MTSYEALAGSYDALTADVDYPRWARYIRRHFARAGRPVRRVLDLACGTGSLTLELARAGYEMVGVDLSEDMLALAEEKCRQAGFEPLFLHQAMEGLRLPERVDACVCCLDSVNYVLQPRKLQRAFRRVYDCLEDGGLFLFDVDTPCKLEQMDGQVFLDETEEVYCVWRGEYSPKKRICSFWMDIFQWQAGEEWLRSGELHREYAYPLEDIEEYLRQAGFARITRHGELKMTPPGAEEQRVFFAARKEEKRNG